MQVAIRQMGNSRGVLIPKPILQELGLSDCADLTLNKGVIEIRPVQSNPRAGWAQDAQHVAAQAGSALIWPEFTNADDAALQW